MPMNRRLAVGFAVAAIITMPALAVAQGQSVHQQGTGEDAGHEAAHSSVRPSQPSLGTDADERYWVERIEFFQIKPDMKVGDYAADFAWNTPILANYLVPKGQFVGLLFNPTIGPFPSYPEWQNSIYQSAVSFPEKLALRSGAPTAERFAALTLDNIPADQKGTFDRILVINMMHFMTRWHTADSEFKAMRELLKPDGMIGIIQHRARADAPYAYANGDMGYMRQDDVIAFMQINGFDLVETSEIGANPRDSADHRDGIDGMPTVFHTRRALMESKGPTDRMTLLFRKRP